ncbi:MAG: hydrogenase nickel incorporation protein HypB [Eubacteriales bacterium]|nr:hydrogenase nickel incorporation protein HypB [Eubacteriales bacterium]MDD3199304.1 hydrogenase nickel incorporation protein HypB [Eubacteriales bacterium]MDD4121303.1 hydrogenase nickel incorporation protein HypB [Eubacteriales bacterium]MDD4629434.1 hydrogenase nickel incorporation protein HypB [Eubacteriales bacterium]
MHDVLKVNMMANIHDENDHIAAHTSEDLAEQHIYAINIMGAPGAGKTTVLKNITKNLKGLKSYVIEGDIESDIDTQDLRGIGIDTYQINTFGACHLDAPMIHNTIQNIRFDKKGILFIENIGNLVCPAEFSIGEHCKMLISTVTEGSDKPYKYPLAFEKADVIILNKTDLLPYIDFDEGFFIKGVRALNKNVTVFKVSGKTGDGFTEVAAWIRERAANFGG